MTLPLVAIIGRPNVGKSTLFNAIVRREISIVDPTPGVTRDRVSLHVTHRDRSFELVDTGGIGIVDSDALEAQVEQQIQFAMDSADLFMFVVDARDGIMPLDQRVAEALRKIGKPIVLAVNKADGPKQVDGATEFYALGVGEPVPCAAKERFNVSELLDRLVEQMPKGEDDGPDEDAVKIAIVGRPNAGKSTLLNTLAQAERVITSEIPGTTRDSVDVRFEWDGRAIVAIDTAGIKKRSQIQNSVAFYGQLRAERAIRRAGLVILMIDASAEISLVDRKIAALVRTSKKPCILAINKWDLAQTKGLETEAYLPYLSEKMPGLGFAPATFISARSGENVQGLIGLAFELYEQAGHRVGTGPLNRVIEEAWRSHKPRVKKGRLPKIYYATQVDVHPPRIALFVNEPGLFGDRYKRYLANKLRDALPFSEVPIELMLRKSGEKAAARIRASRS